MDWRLEETSSKTKTIYKTLHPVWNDATLDIEAICNGDLDRAIKIIIWDHRRSGKHKHMGEFETTINGLIQQRDQLLNTKKPTKRVSGVIDR